MRTRKTVGKIAVLGLAAMLLLAACSLPAARITGTPATIATAAASQSPAPAVTLEPTATATASMAPTATAEPTATATATPVPVASPAPTPSPEPTRAPVIHDGGPDAIGLYLKTRPGVRELVTAFREKWVRGRDIAIFDAFASQEKVLKGDYRKVFNTNWNKYPKWRDYKIGYRLSFTLKSGETVTLTIRSPKDAPKDPKKYFYQYIEVYLYDGIHIEGWYSHLLEKQMKKDTLMTYIKLTAGKKIKDVKSATLAAFVFKDGSDFDPATGEYIGPVRYDITVDTCK